MNVYENQIIEGDSLEVLKTIESNSIDAIVTDPPYGISFMGKGWDYDVPQVELWKEVLRVLKPGGHALVACGTRTQHRMAVNIEDAGFEIRDIVAWVYGSGFPKSLNIGKAVDKLQGNEREVLGKKVYGEGHIQNSVESMGYQGNEAGADTRIDTKGSSPWEGWGTALKPSMELWTLCRKPLEENTVAENVLKWGTGGLNIDGSRVGTETTKTRRNGNSGGEKYGRDERVGEWENPQGRFPANFIHDGSEEVVELFPNTKSGGGIKNPIGGVKTCMKSSNWKDSGYQYSSEGSASRFFYCAKASKAERNKGLEGFEEKDSNYRTEYRPTSVESGDKGQDTPFAGANRSGGVKNFHPTVKPVALMRYLCRLITPPKGTILDPFTGSGSTGIAAKLEGFNFIGIEREKEYCQIARSRINSYQDVLL